MRGYLRISRLSQFSGVAEQEYIGLYGTSRLTYCLKELTMKKLNVIVFFLLATTTLAYAVSPKVIKTVPENGDPNVDPNLRQIRIEFDQDMSQQGYSICGGGPNFPELLGKPRWVNKRTLVVGVKLKPNYEYQMSINCSNYQNCKNVNGEPAEIYPVDFKTASAAPQDPNKPSKSPAVQLDMCNLKKDNKHRTVELFKEVVN
jgi:hypothetical protein